MKIAVLGAGAWGTALTVHLSAQHIVHLWGHQASHIQGMRNIRANPRYLREAIFNSQVFFFTELQEAIKDIDLIVSVVPTHALRNIFKQLKAYGVVTPIVSANKGLEIGTAKLSYEIVADELSPNYHWGVISGPSFAAELVRGLPTAVTLAMSDIQLARKIAHIFHFDGLRIYTSQDVIGVCVGGALKNVIAIAVGISDGMNLGNNARSALITRGLAELMQLGQALGGEKETLTGLSGIGDMILTCTGEYSRNREVGLRLARGENIAQILEQLGHVAEGVWTAKEAYSRASNMALSLPITQEIFYVLNQNKLPQLAVEDLLNRAQKDE